MKWKLTTQPLFTFSTEYCIFKVKRRQMRFDFSLENTSLCTVQKVKRSSFVQRGCKNQCIAKVLSRGFIITKAAHLHKMESSLRACKCNSEAFPYSSCVCLQLFLIQITKLILKPKMDTCWNYEWVSWAHLKRIILVAWLTVHITPIPCCFETLDLQYVLKATHVTPHVNWQYRF